MGRKKKKQVGRKKTKQVASQVTEPEPERFIHSTLAVSPAPQDLFEGLDVSEKVAMDLFMQDPDVDLEDHRLRELVEISARRTYLRALAIQLKGLGFTVRKDEALDAARAQWEARRGPFKRRL